MMVMVNALTAENRHMFKTMKEQGMSISEIARSDVLPLSSGQL
jgi:IS30 family transposase